MNESGHIIKMQLKPLPSRFKLEEKLDPSRNTFRLVDQRQHQEFVLKVLERRSDLLGLQALYSRLSYEIHVAPVVGFFSVDGGVGMVRRFIMGSLLQLINQKRQRHKYFNPLEMRDISMQLFETLYRQGHGALKMENILLDERLQISLVDLRLGKMDQDRDMKSLGEVLYVVATLQSAPKANCPEHFLTLSQWYGSAFCQFVKALLFNPSRHTPSQIYHVEYQRYLGYQLRNISKQFTDHILHDQEYLFNLIKEIKYELRGRNNNDSFFLRVSHNSKQQSHTFAQIFDVLRYKDEEVLAEDMRRFQKYYFDRRLNEIDISEFHARLLERLKMTWNRELEEDLDKELQMQEDREKSMLESQMEARPNDQVATMLETRHKHNKIAQNIKKQLSQRPNLQGMLDKIEETQKRKQQIQAELEEKADALCVTMREELVRRGVGYDELHRRFQQYDQHRMNLVPDQVFLFILKKYQPKLKRSQIEALLVKFHKTLKRKQTRSKPQIFVDYLRFLDQVGDRSIEANQAMHCEVIKKKLRSYIVHKGVDLITAFHQLDIKYFGETGALNFDGWMFVMSHIFESHFSPLDFKELFESYARDGQVEYMQVINDLYSPADKFAEIRLEILATIEEQNTTVEAYFKEMDTDQDAFIDIIEFEKHIMKLVQGTTEEVALEVFDHFDLNRSGQISLAEFTAALGEAYLEQADHYQTIRALVAPVQVIMEEEQYEMLQNPMNISEQLSGKSGKSMESVQVDRLKEILEGNITRIEPGGEDTIIVEIDGLPKRVYINELQLGEFMRENMEWLNIRKKAADNVKNILHFVQKQESAVDAILSADRNKKMEVKQQISIYKPPAKQFTAKVSRVQAARQQSLKKKQTNEWYVKLQEAQIKNKIEEIRREMRRVCKLKGVDMFELFCQHESNDTDFQIDTIVDLELALDFIEMQLERSELQVFFQAYENTTTSYFSIMKCCVDFQSKERWPALIGMAVSYIMLKDKSIHLDILYSELVGEKPYFDLNCLRKINSEWLWELKEDVLMYVYDAWTEQGKVALDYKAFKALLGGIQAASDSKLNQLHYKEFQKALFQVNQFDYLKKMYEGADPLKSGSIQTYKFKELTEKFLGRHLKKSEDKVIAHYLLSEFEDRCSYDQLMVDLELLMEQYIDEQREESARKQRQQKELLIDYFSALRARGHQLSGIQKEYFKGDNQVLMEERTFVKRTQELCGGFDDMKASKVFRLAKLIDGNISTRTQLTVDEFNRFLRTHEIEYEGGHIRTEEADALGIRADIRDLFNECDIDHNESLSLHELHKALKMVGLNCSSLELKELFDMIDKNHDEKIDADEFEKVMLQKVATDLYHGHSLFHEIKKMFKILSHQKNAGITLNIMKQMMEKLSIKISPENLAYIFQKIDFDKSGSIDLHEFLRFIKENQQTSEKRVQDFLFLIKGYNKLTLRDLKQHFDRMPSHFHISQCRQKNARCLHLPSCALRLESDKTGTTIKHMNINYQNLGKKQTHNVLLLTPPKEGLLVKFVMLSAQGVPIPCGNKFSRKNILRREVGIMIYDKFLQSMVENAAYVKAYWSDVGEDQWIFRDKHKRNGFYLRYGSFDLKRDKDLSIIFEFIVYTQEHQKADSEDANIIEISSCFGELSLFHLHNSSGEITVHLSGGSPQAPIPINKEDIRANRKGWKYVQKVFTTVESVLIIRVDSNPKRKELLHEISHLPNLCLVPRIQTTILATFREWCARQIMGDNNEFDLEFVNNQLHLAFLYFIDCPDICERMCVFWNDIMLLNKKGMSSIVIRQRAFTLLIQQLQHCTQIMNFKFDPSNPTDRISVRHQSKTGSKRKAYIKNILLCCRFNIELMMSKIPQDPVMLIGIEGEAAQHGSFDVRDGVFNVDREDISDNLGQGQPKPQKKAA